MSAQDFMKMLRLKHGIDAYWIDKTILKMYSRDYWPLLVYRTAMGMDAKIPAGVIIPRNEGEVVRIVSLANKYGIPIRAYGGGSGVLGAAAPSENEVILDLTKLNWIRWYDKKSRIVDVGVGCYMGELEAWLNSQGYTSRHYPQSINVATVGGLISTMSSGQYSTGYGNIENMLLGVNYVTPAAGLIKIKPTPRGNILPILKSVIIGGEGTYGIITRAYLSVFKKPKRMIKFIYLVENFEEAVKRAYKIIEAGLYPQLFRILDEYESMVNMGIKTWGSVVFGILEGGLATKDNIKFLDKVFVKKLSHEYLDRWYETRNDVIKYLYTMYKSGLAIETIELAAPWSRVLDLYREVRSRVLEIEGVATATAHIGHFYNSGVGIYFTFSIELKNFLNVYESLWNTVEYVAIKNGCSPLHHHGIGRVRARFLREYFGLEVTNLLRILKRGLDPNSVLKGGLSQLLE